MSEPTTEAGRRHIDRWFRGGGNVDTATEEVVAIEAEIRADILSGVRATITEVRESVAPDVMGMSWEAIEQAVARAEVR